MVEIKWQTSDTLAKIKLAKIESQIDSGLSTIAYPLIGLTSVPLHTKSNVKHYPELIKVNHCQRINLTMLITIIFLNNCFM